MLVATALFVLIVAAVASALAWALKRRAALMIGAWLAVLAVLAGTGFLSNFEALPPRMMFVVLPAFAIVIVASRKLSLASIPQAWPIALQSMRAPIELFLYLAFVGGRIPEHMTFAGRNFDVLVGVTAPLVAWAVAKGRLGRVGLVAWNVAGLALLTNIVVLAITAVPGPLHRPWLGPANTIVATVPFAWLPGFLVPVALFNHLVSLRQALKTSSVGGSSRRPTR